MKKGKLIVFSGPSGVGKHTVLEQVINLQELNLAYSISMTTRLKRQNEVDGVDYFFVSKDQFHQAIANNQLIEWAEFVGNFYGTPKHYVQKLLNEGKNVLLEIEVVGAMQILEMYQNNQDELLSIFLLPPSIKELERRLRSRNTESDEIIQKRIVKATDEMLLADKYQYQIINDDPKQAAQQLREVILNATK